MDKFILHSEFKPSGDQPEAISSLANGVLNGDVNQVLLGVTGSGKTFTIANVIEKVQKPTLVLAHNKTLAAQLCAEFKEFFPENAVEYFVSYYDYYQPEAYIPNSDTFIEKDSSINQEIDRLRHSATAALFERKDVIIVASVSCIYGLGDPEDYTDLMVSIRPGMVKDMQEIIDHLIDIRYERNDMELTRGTFRVKGDTLEIMPSDSKNVIDRIEFFGDEIEKISEYDYVTGNLLGTRSHLAVFPASHYATGREKLEHALETIEAEMIERVAELKEQDKIVEAYRLEQRTRFDLEMLRETGFCSGIENYSRHLSGREAGSAPYTLLDYFPDDFLLVVDESHVTLPQVRAMFNGDHARKTTLVDYGFRLPSAFDNRPLTFDEFKDRVDQAIYVSATPAEYERSISTNIAEQLIRPTGLLDPKTEVRPVKGQIDDLIDEIHKTTEKNQRVLVTTLTKRMAESLTDYLTDAGIRVRYLHSDIHTVERMEIINDLRLGEFDVLVGINLLREGLDLPEVSLIAILDADQEGFLRSETSLIQTIGRAARNAEGRVVMYADSVTDSMQAAISETERRRAIQEKYNDEHGIIPKTIKKSVREIIDSTLSKGESKKEDNKIELLSDKEQALPAEEVIEILTKKMAEAAAELRYEDAAKYRDMIRRVKEISQYE